MSRLMLESLEDRTTPATLPTGFSESVLVSGLSNPTSLTVVPDGRLLVAQQGGALRVVQNDQLLATPALSLSVDSTGERGLLGVTVDPSFTTNHFVYLYYTQATGGLHRVSRFTMTGNTINANSELVLLTIPDSASSSNHNGGALHFGPDGKLYIAKGDDAVGSNSQSLNNLHGKILRINADGTIPADNPFFNVTTGDNRAIWALGLRNPFTFDIRSDSRMFINDVGQSSFEEVNVGGAGRNFGWNTTEGTFDTNTFPNFTPPVFTYPHVSGTAGGFAITGGSFYPTAGGNFPTDYAGDYFFADLTNNWIRRIDPNTNAVTLFASNLPSGTVDLDVPADGSLLVLSFNNGLVTRIAANAPLAPTITHDPAAITITQSQGATFAVAVSGTAPLSYQWQRNGNPIPGATKATYTLSNAQTSDSGAMFRVVVSNAAGSATSQAATLTVQAGTPPTPTAVLIGESEFAVGSDTGGPNLVKLFNADQSLRFSVTPFETNFTGGIRVGAADVTGDGVADLILASGPGRVGTVRIYDGNSQGVLFELTPFGDTFQRGINISAGDLNADGKAEVIMSAEQGGGARVRVFTPTGAGFVQRSDFFALIGSDGIADTSFRGGVRTAVGDINGDGTGDLIVAAGAGGGPRLALFNGLTLTLTGGPTLRGDFFAFESSLRDGTNIAAGDFDGDGRADLVVGAGTGGGPRVSVLLGSELLNNQELRLHDFFAGAVTARGGVRVAVKNLDADRLADLIVGSGRNDGSQVRAFTGASLLMASAASIFDFTAFANSNSGIFVG